MELFMPSLIVLILAAIVCFVLLPKASPYILGLIAVVMFVVGAWQHYHMFPYEYSSSLFIELLRDYAPFVMLLGVIIGGMIALMLAFGVSPPNISDIIPEGITDMLPANNTKPANNANKPANNGNVKSANNTNNSKRNNIASSSFKTI